MGDTQNILILCTGNSARSILAEGILLREGKGRFHAYSAGSQPKDNPHPLALELLQRKGFNTNFARSKSWDEFAGEGAPKLDFIFTVCDSAASEACPIWPGHPTTVHWGIPDPAAAQGSEDEKRHAFEEAYQRLDARISAFLSLPLNTLDAASLKEQLTAIGKMED